MGEITTMVSDARYPHDQHIYDYFTATEKFVRTAVPQLVADYLDQFREQLIIEFETYFNGEKMHHDQIAQAIGDILDKSIGASLKNIKISF
jgi:hypothetical protein